uniref:Lipocalin n=1 Tax=Ixodes ricinus TaxID=34613 RepID=A0A0K8R8K4_IXORI
MFGPRETMIALFYLAILFLCQSHAILLENNEEKSGMDFPDAKKGYFPELWKFSVIAPIFKSGDSTLVNNYRPVSLLCGFAKVFEKVMASLKKTYMFKSLINSPNVKCAYQIFYDLNVHGYGSKNKYDKVSLFKDGRFLNNPLYVRDVVNSTIYLSSNPVINNNPTELEILYSDFESCMVTKGPNLRYFPHACRLWLTNSSFAST